MNLNKDFSGYLVFLLLSSLVLLSGCKAVEISSKWRDKDIVIDANDNEWQDARQYNDKKTQSTIGVYNDDSNVYFCLTTLDTDIQTAVVTQGFIVWLNGKGTKEKELGIRFPVVEQEGPGGQGAPSGPDREGLPPSEEGATGGPGGPGGGPGESTVSLSELKILTSKKDEGTAFEVSEAAQMGMSAWIANQNNKLVYELQIPLQKTDETPYGVIPSATNSIGVGFMLYSIGSPSTRGISGFGGSMSDMGSGGGMGGGGMGGGGFDMSGDQGFNMRDVSSSMSNVFRFFSTTDDDIFSTSDEDFFSTRREDVSIINAQGAPPGGGMGGGMGDGGMGGDMGGGGMGGSMPSGDMGGGVSLTRFEVWFNVTLATR